MSRAAVAATVLCACLQVASAAQGVRPPQPARSTATALSPPDALLAILAAEDSRLSLPDDLHTPGIDTLRAKQMEDLRLLVEFARSKDQPTQIKAIRALGRLERREVIPELLQYLTLGPTEETAQAIAQAFRGPALPDDSAGQQAERSLEMLIVAGIIPADPRDRPGSIGPVSLAIGRLPYRACGTSPGGRRLHAPDAARRRHGSASPAGCRDHHTRDGNPRANTNATGTAEPGRHRSAAKYRSQTAA